MRFATGCSFSASLMLIAMTGGCSGRNDTPAAALQSNDVARSGSFESGELDSGDTERSRGAPGGVPTTRVSAALSDSGNGFERAEAIRAFEFPRDYGPHPGFRHEWWYVTGNLDSADGERFGFELTFFRFALAPLGADDAVAEDGSGRDAAAKDTSIENAAAEDASVTRSRWRTRQIYMAHFALTDVARGEFHFRERFARDALGLAGAQAEPFRVWLEDWEIGEEPPASLLTDPEPAVETESDGRSEAAAGRWFLTAADEDRSLTLELRPLSGPVLNGEQGLSRKSGKPGSASYYYSIPRIAARGTLELDGRTFDVSGFAWLDREWGSGSLGADQEGWDWFALQLDDGSALMFYVLRKRDGSRDPHSAGTWVGSDGLVRTLASDEVTIEVLDRWQSPRGGRYPARWRLRVPALGLDVDVRPVLDDQELIAQTRYWEGAVDVEGMRGGGRISGRGYVELVGYAR